MAQQLRALVDLAENLGLVLITHMVTWRLSVTPVPGDISPPLLVYVGVSHTYMQTKYPYT